MTTLTLQKTKITGSIKTFMKVCTTKTVASIEAHILCTDVQLVFNNIDLILKRVFGEKAQYKCELLEDKLTIEIMFTFTKELTFVQLCALEDATSCMLDKLQDILETTKSINHAVEDLYGTICNYGSKNKKPASS